MKRKICFLTDSLFSIGGVQRVTAVIARAMAEECQVTIVTFDPPQSLDRSFYGLDGADIGYRFFSYPTLPPWKRLFCKVYSALYRKLHLPWRWASDLYALSSFPSPLRHALACELRQGDYDAIVGVHAPLAVRLATIARQLAGVKCVGWIHNSFEALYGPGSTYIGPELKRHYVFQLMKLDQTVVLCQHDADVYQLFDHRFRPSVIYNPLTLQPGAPSKGVSKQFLAVGRFTPRHKGFDLLIKAFAIFARNDNLWTLHIVGEGPEESLYRRLIDDNGLAQRVFLHPFTHDIQRYYSDAQVYVLSSRWEGFGLVLVEAMAHGLPVVSSNLPTSLEIMGEEALYFENGNVQQLARRLHDATLIDWSQASHRAIEAARRFDIGSIREQWKQVLLR
ncbi:MAG: glycosyltransferase [Prevotella sp.]|nr:glycosyltransferase [Prevotella sp.]